MDYNDYKKKYDELCGRDESKSESIEYWESLVNDIRDFFSNPNTPNDLVELAKFSLWESAGMTLESLYQKAKSVE